MSFFRQHATHRLGPHFLIWLPTALLLVASWLLAFGLIKDDRTATVVEAEKDLVNLGRLSQEHAERTFFSVDQTLRMVLGQYQEHGGKIDLKAMAGQGVFDTRILHQVSIIDAHGILRFSSLPFSGRIDLSDREHFKAHLVPGADPLFISRAVLGRASGKWSIQLSRRITGKNGEFAGVVVASVDPSYFTRFYGELKLGQHGVATLFGMDGAIRARKFAQREDFSGDISSSPVFARLARGEDTSTITFRASVDGVERTYHFRKLPSYPLLVAIGMSTQKIFAAHEKTKSHISWFVVITSFLLLALAAIASWSVVAARRYLAAQRQALVQLQTITRRIPGVVYQYLLRPDGSACFPFASEGVRDIYGLSPEALAGDAAPVMSLIHPDDVAGVGASIDASARTLTPWLHEFRVGLADGSVRWLSGNAAPQKLADGSVLWDGFVSDVTVRKQADESLSTFSAAVEQSPVSILITNLKGDIEYVNPRFEAVSGYTRAEVIGQNPRILSSGKKSADDYRDLWATLLTGKTWTGEFHNHRKDGSLYWEQATISPIFDDHGVARHYLAIKENISERKLAEENLRIAATAFESQEGMFITDEGGVILRVNRAFSEITGYSSAEAVGKTPGLLSSGRHDAAFYTAMRESIEQSGSWQGEIWNRRKNGEVFPEWLTITAVKDEAGKVTHHVSTLADITTRKAAEDQIKHLAFYDPLTGLPNRRLLMERLKQALAGSMRHGRNGALLFIDLDNFKNINDTLGHHQGDLLLQQVAERLGNAVREGDSVARVGGDEFVVMLQDLSQNRTEAATQTEAVGEKILLVLSMPYVLSHVTYHCSASVGVALFNERHDSVVDLFKRADLALYQAKDAGRNTICFFDPEMQAALISRAELETDLRQGLQEKQFLIYYQPQVNSQGRLMGVEALVRWQHPRRGMVSPAQFIPLAEDTRLILPLGQWVLETACHQLKAWAAQPHTAHLTLAVNVSALQFRSENFVQEVLATIALTGAPASRLKLELTESLLIKDVEDIIAKMQALKARGVGFSLDDFGTGYSSLSYLKRLPLDQLKIDQSFLRDAATHPDDAAIVKAIVVLGQSLGLMVIAEGVETQAQRDFLEAEGCHNFQGYYFGYPGPVQALAHFFQPK